MLYKLLRDNKESGPYTKSELMNMELLSSDFLRPDVEGSRWILANKFTELKSNIESSKPKPKYKITADGQLIEIKKDADEKSSAEDAKESGEMKNVENSPFRRAPSAAPKRKISDNEEPFDYQTKSETFAPTSRNVSPTDAEKNNNQEENKTKKTAGNILKEIIIPIGILGAVFLGWQFYNNKTGNGSKETKESINAMVNDMDNKKQLETNNENASTADNSNITTIPVQMPATTTASEDSLAALREKRAALKKKNDSIALALSNKKIADSLAAIRANENAKTAENNKQPETPAPVAEKPKPAVDNTKKTETATPATTAKKSNSVRDYVRLSLTNPAKSGYVNAKIKVNNVSKTNLNVAVLRVRYLDAKGNVLKSETIQVDNIRAGRSVIVGIPDSKEAEKISYGATMISGDDVYIMR